MYLRELYLRQIRPFYRNEQIKILTGVRRAGKTELLKMIQRELLVETNKRHIVYLSFELLENRKYRDASVLYEYLQTRIVDEGMFFIFLDEIQFVKERLAGGRKLSEDEIRECQYICHRLKQRSS